MHVFIAFYSEIILQALILSESKSINYVDLSLAAQLVCSVYLPFVQSIPVFNLQVYTALS
jgi:hypothetical protein